MFSWISLFILHAVWPLLLLAAGCAGPHASLAPAGDPEPEAVEINDAPAFQQRANQCAAASLASVLHWSGFQLSPQELEPLLYNPERQGTLQPSIKGSARRIGALPYEIQGKAELLAQLQAGIPVLVLLNKGLSWLPTWHYAVVCGLDPEQGSLCLLDGGAEPRWISEGTFLRTWARADYWGLVVLSPGRLPAAADKSRYLNAVYALEQSGQYAQAEKGYQAALSKWPGDLAGLLGRANCFYQLRELEKAEACLRRAAELHPGSAPAWNNLAQVLAEQGRKLEALQAAQKAVSMGEEHLEHYQQTWESILAPDN
ncbi:MAG: PA2778 family cysteine peptidase [Desulfohalobiaceae bacterium]